MIKRLRRNVFLTLGITSMAGVTVLFFLIFAGTTLKPGDFFESWEWGLSWQAIQADWNAVKGSAWGLLGVTLLTLFFSGLGQYLVNERVWRDVEDFFRRVERGAEPSSDQVAGIWRQSLLFPLVLSAGSLGFWFAGAGFIPVVASQLPWMASLPRRVWFEIFGLGVMTSLVLFPFQYYRLKVQFHPLYEKLAEHLDLSQIRLNAPPLTIQRKLSTSFLILLSISLCMVSYVVYRQCETAILNQAELLGWERLRTVAQHLMTLSEEDQEDYLGLMATGKGTLLLVGPGERKVGTRGGKQLSREQVREAWGRLTREGPAHDERVMAVSVQAGVSLTGLYSWNDFQDSLGHMRVTIGIVLVLMLAVSLYIGFLAAKDVSFPLRGMMEFAGRVARGDVAGARVIPSDDELGSLSQSFGTMVSGLRGMILSVTEAAGRIERTGGSLREISEKVSSRTRSQSELLVGTRRSIEEMGKSTTSIAESLCVLNRSVQEGTSSICELDATTAHVVEAMESLVASVEETTSSTTEMIFSRKQVDENIEFLRLATDDTVASIAQMDASIKRVDEEARQTSGLAGQAAREAEVGAWMVSQTIEGIQRIRGSFAGMGEILARLNGRIDDIGNILTVIKKMTSDTSLLALNAAILASQAGEHGAGFSVVADEIKDLAERTAVSTKEIAAMIKAVQDGSGKAMAAMRDGMTHVDEGVSLSQHAGEALEQILTLARESDERGQIIARATGEQSTVARKASQSMERIGVTSTQINQAMKEMTKGVDQILRASEEMRKVTGRVKVSVQEQLGGSKTITRTVGKTGDMVRQIDEASQMNAKEGESVERALESVAAENRASTEHVVDLSGIVRRLSLDAEMLKEQVRRFRLG